MTEAKFNSRGFVSLVTTFSFLVMVVTGIVLYIEPHGRVAYWTDWRLLGLGKDGWDGIHIVTSVVFLVAAGFHTYFNWKQLLRYLGVRAREGARQWRELGLAGGIVLIVCVGTAASWYPFAWILDLNDAAKSAWVTEPAEQPPFGHAEMVSIGSLSRKLGLDEHEVLANLAAVGIRADLDQTVEAVAERGGVTPRDLYRIMRTGNEAGQRGRGAAEGRGDPAGSDGSEATWDAARPEEHADDAWETDHARHVHHAGEGRGLHRPPGGRGLHGARRGGGAAAVGSPAAQRVFQKYSGSGLGKRSIASLCAELGIPADEGVACLSRQGIEASSATPIRSVAAAYQMQPAAILAAICKEGGCR